MDGSGICGPPWNEIGRYLWPAWTVKSDHGADFKRQVASQIGPFAVRDGENLIDC